MWWRWNWLGSLLWNLLIHTVTLQWGLVGGDLDAIKHWFDSLWGEVLSQVNGVRSWASGRISWLQGYAFGLYVQAVNLVYDLRNRLRDEVNSWIGRVYNWANDRLSWLQGYAFGLYIQALNALQSARNAIESWVYNFLTNSIAWVRGLFDWIQPYRDLITNFLVGARAVIEWLWFYAWGQLQAFLRDPVGYVLGWLLTPIRNLVNWWNVYGVGLMNFVSEDLPRLRTLLAAGYALLRNLVDHPAETILDILAPIILEWLARRLAEEW